MSANDREHLKIFGCSAGLHLAREMCNHLELPIGGGKATRFPDGEIIVKLEEDVRGRDCYIVQSTCEPVNDNLYWLSRRPENSSFAPGSWELVDEDNQQLAWTAKAWPAPPAPGGTPES